MLRDEDLFATSRTRKGTSAMTVYHVATSGSDSADGSASAPLRTISAAAGASTASG